MIIPDTRQRLEAAYEELQTLLVSKAASPQHIHCRMQAAFGMAFPQPPHILV